MTTYSQSFAAVLATITMTICCGYSKRAEIQRQRGMQEETNHVYSNDTNNDNA
jgi:hypothetical protein